MAIFYSDVANGYRIIFHINVTSQDMVENESTCSWVFQIENGHTHYDAPHTGSAYLRFSTASELRYGWAASEKHFNSGPSGSVKTIASGSSVIYHRDDGTRTLLIEASLKTVTQGMSWSLPEVTISDEYVLPYIPRQPGRPAPPTYTVNHEERTVTVTSAPASSVAPILEYQIERRDNTTSIWIAATADSNRQITYSPGDAPKRLEFRSRARTVAGWGLYSRSPAYDLVWKPYPLDPPTVTQNLSTRLITVTAPVADASGSRITAYQIRRRDRWAQSDWTIHSANLTTRSYRFTPDRPLTSFDFQARASTSAGWSDWGTTFSSIDGTGSGSLVRVSGVYKKTNAFVKVAGVWRPAIVWIKHNGVWKQAVR